MATNDAGLKEIALCQAVRRARMAKHHIMDQTGHSTVEFDKADPQALKEAQARFDRLVAEHYTPAVRGEDGMARVTRTFDPDASETLFVPQLVGG
jgi:hypothetical protein